MHFLTHPGQWKWILDVDRNYVLVIISWSWKLSLGLACTLKLVCSPSLNKDAADNG